MLWAALVIFVVAAAASTAFVVVRALELWRGFRGAGAAMSEALARVTAGADAVGEKAEALGGPSSELGEAAARLASSRARLDVLTSAFDDVRGSVEEFELRK